MDYIEKKKVAMMAKYGYFLNEAKGGIFSRKAREKLIGKVRSYGKNQTNINFWYDRRNDIKSAFVDLTLFFEVAGRKNVNQVFEDVDIELFLDALLRGDKEFPLDDSNPKKAMIVQKLVEAGLLFLSNNLPHKITLSHKRTIEEAIDLTEYLVSEFVGAEPYGEEGSYFGQWKKMEREE